MVLDPWLPVGYQLPDAATSRLALFEGAGWQILQAHGDSRVLVVHEHLAERWINSGILEEGALLPFEFGSQQLRCLSSGLSQSLCPVSEAKAPASKSEALAFAVALKATREIDQHSPLQDALYVEKFSRLLPTYSISPRTEDDLVFGLWLTGGASISVTSFRRLHQVLSWLDQRHLKDIVEAAGFEVTGVQLSRSSISLAADYGTVIQNAPADLSAEPSKAQVFELPGRPELAAFINEHVVDVIQNRERYKALGIGFPSAIVLHGPPGTGKTFAVERLVDFLGWPDFVIDASSVASPYIHETSRKVAEVFEKAMENAPSVLVIDEMEAFLADRDMGGGHHHVEEIAEFLRRIPEAAKNEVLIVAMTNRIDLIDAAILRRGRFDHVIKVDYASEGEVSALLVKLLSALPKEQDLDVSLLARELTGRPLSDVAFVVREAARLAARAGKDCLDNDSLLAALSGTPSRQREDESQRRIGFM